MIHGVRHARLEPRDKWVDECPVDENHGLHVMLLAQRVADAVVKVPARDRDVVRHRNVNRPVHARDEQQQRAHQRQQPHRKFHRI